MKVENPAAVSQPMVNKVKGQLSIRGDGAGGVVIQSRRKKRGNRGTPNQASWVEDFSNAAKAFKMIGGCTHGQAADFADSPPAGYTFWRDYLSWAGAGKHMSDNGNTPINPQTPRISALREPGVFKVTTPSACVHRTSAQSVLVNNFTVLTPNALDWDNNFFWSPTENPSRLTARANGLYLIGAYITFAVGSTARREVRLRVNGADVVGQVSGGEGSSGSGARAITALWPFIAGDYVEVLATAAASGQTALISKFWIVGITPETIV